MTLPVGRRWADWRHRLDPDAEGGLRLTLVAGAAFVLAVPFALALLAVVDGWGPLHRLDLHVADSLNRDALTRSGLVSFLQQVCNVCSPSDFRIVGAVAALWLWLARRQPRLALWLVVTIGLSDPLDILVKNAVARPRPHFLHPVVRLTSYSFPSGHAVGSIVGVGALLLAGLPLLEARARPLLVVAGAGLVVLVGYARIALGAHYVSDVVGGWLLGGGWLMATTAAFRAWQHDLHEPARPLSAGLEADRPEPGRTTG